LSQAENFLAQT
jgi:NIMA (never in mitosis gene a)-related kinase